VRRFTRRNRTRKRLRDEGSRMKGKKRGYQTSDVGSDERSVFRCR
jgi:hypothetical protein